MEDSIDDIEQSLRAQTDLHSLTLSYIGNTGLKSIGIVLASNRTLRMLHVSWSKITEQGLVLFLEAAKNNLTLEALHLTKNKVTQSKIINLKQSIKNLTYTFEIYASWNEITTNQGSYTTLKSMITLLSDSDNNDIIKEEIWSYKETFSTAGIAIFSDCLKEDNSIQELNFCDNFINSDRVKVLTESLTENTTVKILNLSYNKLYNSGATVISTYLKNNSSVQEVDISRNHITIEGAKKIAEVIQVNKTIHTLNLWQYITNEDDQLLFNTTILTAVHHNNTLIKLTLPFLFSDDNKMIIANEVEKINTSRKRKGISTLTCDYTKSNYL